MAKQAVDKLFKRMFKKNSDPVVLIDDDDTMWRGVIYSVNDDQVTLKNLRGKLESFWWCDVRFFGLEGFPVKRLKGADGSAAIMLEESIKTQRRIRETLLGESITEKRDRLEADEWDRLSRWLDRHGQDRNHYHTDDTLTVLRAKYNRRVASLNKEGCLRHDAKGVMALDGGLARVARSGSTIRLGDPFEILDVACEIVNPGACPVDREDTDAWDSFSWEMETLILTAKDGAVGLLWDIPSVYIFEAA